MNSKNKNECNARWAKNNPEKVRASSRKYYRNNRKKVERANKKWQSENWEKFRKSRKEYERRNAEKLRKQRLIRDSKTKKKRRLQNKRWKIKNPEKVRASMFKTRYGAPFSLFKSMLKKQRGKCAICRTEKAIHTDHCHKTGKIRGVLCQNCNFAIGLMKDSCKRLRSAIKYLSK